MPLSSYPVRRALLLMATVAAVGAGAYHRTPLTEPSDTNSVAAGLLLSNASFKRISEGVYSLGLVKLDKQKRTVSFPATVNMSEGLVEYALVHTTGKVHESVLRTEADALHIHLARLLIGPIAPAPASAASNSPRELLGPHLSISVQWKVNGTDKRLPLEDLITNTLTRVRMTRGDWVYNGSRLVQGTFLAQRDGSIVAIIADPDALINNPRPGRDDDEIWKANTTLLPAAGTPVEVSLELASSSTD
jgi:hypothetical protein